MKNNITREDLDVLINFLENEPVLTQSVNVRAFEEEWSKWVGVKYSVFVNSGSSANFLTLSILRQLYGRGEIILPTLTWVSDIASVLHCGFTPVFVDINPRNLCTNEDQVLEKINQNTVAVFITYAQGFNGLSDRLLNELHRKDIVLIEDVCEAHGATFKDQKLGSFGLMSNFSFYYAHHLSTIEGGMVCTNNEKVYELLRMGRSHGLVREASDDEIKEHYINNYRDLNPDFIFAFPAFNMRNNEVGAVIGRNQLKRLDQNIARRNENHRLFLSSLDSSKFRTKFTLEGSSNYAFNLIIRKADHNFCQRVMQLLTKHGIEFRRGSSGGGNQLRQPYLADWASQYDLSDFREVDHVHFFGFYIGNYPDLGKEKILRLGELLNGLSV